MTTHDPDFLKALARISRQEDAIWYNRIRTFEGWPRKYHQDFTQPEEGQIFVFGSDYDGRHTKGAALHARRRFGAVTEVTEGMSGQSYALPTVAHGLQKMDLDQIRVHVNRFLDHSYQNMDKEFLMTRVGCVRAGHSDAEIAPMFAYARSNISFPLEWEPYLR